MQPKFHFSPDKASEEIINNFLLSRKIIIPNDYKTFLLGTNGGTPDPTSFHSRLTDETVYAVNFFGLINSLDQCVGYNLELMADILWTGSLPSCLLPIADDGCGNEFLMSVREKDFGAIYFRDCSLEIFDNGNESHETADLSLPRLFNSFSEFIDSSISDPLESPFESLLRSKNSSKIITYIKDRRDLVNAPVRDNENMLDIIFFEDAYKGFQIPEIVELLIKLGGCSDFCMLGREYNTEVTKILIDSGMSINKKILFNNNMDWTYPILILLRNQTNLELFEYYVQNGADLNVKDSDGNTPLQCAKQKYDELKDCICESTRRLILRQEKIIHYLQSIMPPTSPR